MSSGFSRMRTLILALEYPHRASYYDDWRDAFCDSPQLECAFANILSLQPRELARRLEEHDAVIMLHSCNSDTLEFLAPLAPVLGARKRARLLTFVGNEFNSPYVSLIDKVRLFREARCDIVATQLLEEAGRFLYADSGAEVVSIPHALNPRAFRPGPEHAARRLDLGVRGYRYPPYLGDDDRNRLLDFFRSNAARMGLVVDIAHDRRLGREGWAQFLADCRGTLSTETGSWYLDRDDALVRRVYAHMAARRSGLVIGNQSVLRRAARRLPSPVKAALAAVLKRGPIKFEVFEDDNVPFAELYEAFFRTAPRPPVYGKAVSSRHFDAVGTKTCQIMVRGRFNDILTAEEHYIGVDASLADAAEAVRRFRDDGLRQAMADAAYEHVMSAHTYAHRARDVVRALGRV